MSNQAYLQADEQHQSQLNKRSLGDMKSLLVLLHYLKPYKWKFTIAISLMFCGGAAALMTAKLMEGLVDDGLAMNNFNKAWLFASGILLAELLAILFNFIGRRVLSHASSLSILMVRKGLFAHLQELPLKFYDRQPQGRIVTRVTHDVEGMEEFFTNSLGRFIQSTLLAVMAMITMLVASPKLGSIIILSNIPFFIIVYLLRNVVRKANRNMSASTSAVNSRLAEYLNGMTVIRSLGLEQWSMDQYQKRTKDNLKTYYAANILFSWSRPLITFLVVFPFLGLVWFGGNEVLAGTMGLGFFIAFIRYCERFYHPIMTLARELHVIQQAFTSAERIALFLAQDREEKVFGQDGKIDNYHMHGSLVFDNVTMAYDGEHHVLKNVSFEVSRGEKIGLVGRTGSGKTTTISLLARLYDFQQGKISIDNINLRDFKRNYLRSQIGVVSQDVILFNGSLRENLTCEAKIADDQILKACTQTGLIQVFEDSQLNLDSEILEGGSNLSVGERQLVSITRILLRRPTILVLDEATANIDPEFERIIHNAVDKLMDKRTCFIIAHRLETLKSCDRILAFKDGRIVEEGTHEKLMESRGYYWQLQQGHDKLTWKIPGQNMTQ